MWVIYKCSHQVCGRLFINCERQAHTHTLGRVRPQRNTLEQQQRFFFKNTANSAQITAEKLFYIYKNVLFLGVIHGASLFDG